MKIINRRCIKFLLEGEIKKVSIYKWLVVIVLATFSCTSGWEIDNPYENVDWENHTQYKANFHTHTTRSDGRLNPDKVVDIYKALGYDILAITDHNEVTYPWTCFSEMDASSKSYKRLESTPETMPEKFEYQDRDPVLLKMIDVEGNEFSMHHHMGSFFNGLMGTADLEESIEAVAEQDGVIIINHPGRYNFPVNWYVDLFQNNDHIIGLEVFNKGDSFPNDRSKWDSILTVTMPCRPIWAYSNDDMHMLSHVGRNWNMLVLNELTHESVRDGMERGLSYYIYAPKGHDGPEPPFINSIEVNRQKGTILINASGYNRVEWISEGKVVHDKTNLNLNELENLGSYVRAVFYGLGETVAGTQPFGLGKKP